MPLELLAILVPLGIALVVLVVKFSGLSHSARLKGEKHAISVFLLDYPSEKPDGKVLISANSNAAFLRLEGVNATGLVEVIGDRFLARIVAPSQIRSARCSGEKLRVRYHDFTHPRAMYQFDSNSQAERALRWLQQNTHQKAKPA